MKRVFIAIPIPVLIAKQLLQLKVDTPAIKWTNADNLHLTVCFIGNVTDKQISAIEKILTTMNFCSFSLSLKKVSYFCDGNGPKVLWCGINNEEKLIEFQEKLVQELQNININYDRRAYYPHITIARLKKISSKSVEELLEQYGQFHTEKFKVSFFNLYTSTLLPTGAKYSIRSSYKLK